MLLLIIILCTGQNSCFDGSNGGRNDSNNDSEYYNHKANFTMDNDMLSAHQRVNSFGYIPLCPAIVHVFLARILLHFQGFN